MKYQKQRFRHEPEKGVFGDCMRTCYAVLLGVEPEEVPHFMDTGEFNQELHDGWLNEQGLLLIRTAYLCTESMEAVMRAADAGCPGMPYILSGWSRTPSNHCVVAVGLDVYCDPSFTNSGIVGPMHCEDGSEMWWIEWLVRRL